MPRSWSEALRSQADRVTRQQVDTILDRCQRTKSTLLSSLYALLHAALLHAVDEMTF
jgi:hypothetical protein